MRSIKLFDGAFGSYYHTLTGDAEPCEMANLYAPQTVRRIHREYIEAGAQAIKTNTFGANRFALNVEENVVNDILREGYFLAKEVAGDKVDVYCDIGPIAADDRDDSIREILHIVEQFLSFGADRFLFETWPGLSVVKRAARYIKEKQPDAHIIVSFAVGRDGYSNDGNYYKNLIDQADQNEDIEVCGLNCVCGPVHMYYLARQLSGKGRARIFMPNAGYPIETFGRLIYDDNAEYYSEKILQFAHLGCDILGGCCGTTPEHIRKCREKLDAFQPQEFKESRTETEEERQRHVNRLIELIRSGRKVIATEISPPVDFDGSRMVAGARYMMECGADLITVPDSPLSRARANSMMCASLIKRETGMQVMPHLACRDRNMVGMKSVLLAGRMDGIDTVLAITGDPMEHKIDSPDRGVFSLNSFDLIRYIHHLNDDVFKNHEYLIAGALNLNVPNFSAELRRAVRKENNGAQLFFTQPVLDERAKRNLKEARRALKNSYIMVGIMPIASYKNAVFINNEIAGMNVPQELVDQMKDKEEDEVYELSTKFSAGIVREVYDDCDGFYLITPLGRFSLVGKLIAEIRSIEKERLKA